MEKPSLDDYQKLLVGREFNGHKLDGLEIKHYASTQDAYDVEGFKTRRMLSVILPNGEEVYFFELGISRPVPTEFK